MLMATVLEGRYKGTLLPLSPCALLAGSHQLCQYSIKFPKVLSIMLVLWTVVIHIHENSQKYTLIEEPAILES